MGLFGSGKKNGCCCGSAPAEEVKECACGAASHEAESSCCCGGQEADGAAKEICSVKVLGAGCRSCHELFENVSKAVEELGLGIEVEYITDMEKVMTYGVMSMPVIVINEKVVSMGKVLKPAEVIKLFGKLGY